MTSKQLIKIPAQSLKLAIVALTALLLAFVVREQTRPDAQAAEKVTESATAVTFDTTKPASEITAPAGGWSFRNHVIPVLTRLGCNSGACHGAASGKAGFKLTLRGYDPEADFNVLTRQSLGRRVNQMEPAKSLMLLKPTMAIGHGGGKRINVDSLEYKVLVEWIANGMTAPAENDVRITKVEVTPKTSTLASGAEQQLRVLAQFSDGHAEDVTKWVRYSSADPATASVDEAGKVKMQGNGETAISIWYLSQVSFARVANPYPNKIAPEVFDRSPRQNFIDELVIKKLQILKLAPSEQATDREFIRRAFLDATGTLPSPQEVERFVVDNTANKRALLIDNLQAREEFTDYWTNRWADVLLVSSDKIGSTAMWSFHNWIRDGVAANKPWDKMVREIVTASGNTLENGAANYYVMHKEVTDLTENASMAFLGMSITCARCHNHPLEKWTQKQYFQMANLFARVGLKNGVRAGDVQVYSNPTGEVNHPRLGKPLPPAPLDGEAMTFDSPKDRRQHLADWLTSPSNPYFARAVVNRVWKNFMGRGFVEAVDDMRATNPPSNEELLNALTKDFTDHRFDIKHLIRTVMNSAAYQRSSKANEANKQDERFYSRYVIKRLPAEAVLDAVSQVTGVATEFPGYPAGMRAVQIPDARVNSYFLTIFGKPPRFATCECERTSEPSVTQALHVINGDTINQKLRAPGGLVDSFMKLGMTDEALINHLYLSALSRQPSLDEINRLLAVMNESKEAAKDSRDARRQAIEDLAWAVLTSKEFLFNH
ncbi:MAG: DUF1553 domain-containing protein [Acidobacteriota bacterium]|nr:DUF1553 domain-containing protein [Acidobacteriota bacterium]